MKHISQVLLNVVCSNYELYLFKRIVDNWHLFIRHCDKDNIKSVQELTCEPLKLQRKILFVRVFAPSAIKFQHIIHVLIETINSHFNKEIVEKIIIKQFI